MKETEFSQIGYNEEKNELPYTHLCEATQEYPCILQITIEKSTRMHDNYLYIVELTAWIQ